MTTYEAIHARYSYRGEYQNTTVPREDLVKILEAGCAAPSGCNCQTTSFIAVDDPELMQTLFTVIPKGLGKTAPAMICVLTRKIIAYRDRTFYIQDYSAAIENMLLTITELGYASCWVEGHVTGTHRVGDHMAALLGVPEEYELVAYLPVGIPVAEGSKVEKKPLEKRAWLNRFGNPIK